MKKSFRIFSVFMAVITLLCVMLPMASFAATQEVEIVADETISLIDRLFSIHPDIYSKEGIDITGSFYRATEEAYSVGRYDYISAYMDENLGYAEAVICESGDGIAPCASYTPVSVKKWKMQYLREEIRDMEKHNYVSYYVTMNCVYNTNEGEVLSASKPIVEIDSYQMFGGVSAEFEDIYTTATISSDKSSVDYAFERKMRIYISEIDGIMPLYLAYRYTFSDSYTIYPEDEIFS